MKTPLQINTEAYRTDEAIEKYSSYNLYNIEKLLFAKYYREKESVLDLACGTGRTTVRLHELGLKVTGIDLSDKLINIASKRFPYIHFEIGSYCDIKMEGSSFDHVLISHNGIDYAHPESERITAIQESYRVLKKDGTLILSSHNIKSLYFSPYYLKHWRRILWKVKNSLMPLKSRAYIFDLGMHTFYGSPQYITHQVEEQGFTLVEKRGFRISTNNFFNTYISPYIHYVFRKI